MDWGDLVTKSAAGLGAGLGIFNSWHGWRQGKVRLQVTPTMVKVQRNIGQTASGAAIQQPFLSPGIAVVNLSSFPVTVEEVGYDLKSGDVYPLSRIDARGQWSQSGMWTPDRLPQRLEARASLRVAWWDKDEDSLKGKRIRSAYARTACGARVRRSNRVLRNVAERLANRHAVMEPVEHGG